MRSSPPDLVDAVVAQDFGAGYYELVPIRRTAATDQITLKVRAVGRSGGRIWNSTPVTFTVVQPAQPAELPKAAFARDFEVPVREPSVRPRICIFTHSLSIGGAELYLEELLLRLTAAGVADFMVICPEDGVMRTALEEVGIAVHIGSDPPADARRYVDRVAELSSVLLAWRCDVVMVNTMGAVHRGGRGRVGARSAVRMGDSRVIRHRRVQPPLVGEIAEQRCRKKSWNDFVSR